jgi:hypothetical protein
LGIPDISQEMIKRGVDTLQFRNLEASKSSRYSSLLPKRAGLHPYGKYVPDFSLITLW